MPLLGAQIGAQLGLNAVNQFGNIAGNFMQYRINRRDALNDWNREAHYNSPAEQVKRLKDAHLSPYAMSGNAFTASTPQTRNTPLQSTQNTAPVNVMGMQQGLQQLRNQVLQNESVEQDIVAKKLDNSVNAETKRSEAFGRIWNMEAQLNSTNMGIAEKKQHIEVMKGQLLSLAADTQLKQTEALYQNRYLQGRNDLQDLQKNQISASTAKLIQEIKSIQIHNEQDVKMFQYRIDDITQRIQQLRNDNESRSYQNYYLPESLRYERDIKKTRAELDKEQLEYTRTLSPQMRFAIDKLGDGNAIKALMRTRGMLKR